MMTEMQRVNKMIEAQRGEDKEKMIEIQKQVEKQEKLVEELRKELEEMKSKERKRCYAEDMKTQVMEMTERMDMCKREMKKHRRQIFEREAKQEAERSGMQMAMQRDLEIQRREFDEQIEMVKNIAERQRMELNEQRDQGVMVAQNLQTLLEQFARRGEVR